jgi:hypothetical protein
MNREELCEELGGMIAQKRAGILCELMIAQGSLTNARDCQDCLDRMAHLDELSRNLKDALLGGERVQARLSHVS